MYKKILVPLDGSTFAEVILPHIHHMATLYEADIIFLLVLELSHTANFQRSQDDRFYALPSWDDNLLQKQISESESYLDEQVLRTEELGIKAKSRIEYGPVAATIINTAVEEDVDLIAMASHGASGLQGIYYGSVAAGVLQRVDRPLLIVRSHDI
ncbi:MAG: universal stress protein [Candidatus Promineifilaceae bacterium]|nr:universal stress protein [Candidatus Promineifilaceae bacterium]